MRLPGVCIAAIVATIGVAHATQSPMSVAIASAQLAAAPSSGTRLLAVPVEGFPRNQLFDSYQQQRGGKVHEAIDIAAPRGTRVVAVDDGRIVKLFNSRFGGLTIYQFDPEQRLAYYYAHLDRYADGVHEGMAVRRGEHIGYVGTSGNAAPDAPHLHFAVFRLGPERQWWKGTPINPYELLRGPD